MGKREILTRSQWLLHNNRKLYEKFLEKFPEGENFYTLETFSNPYDEKVLNEWHQQIDYLCKVYNIESADDLFSIYNKDFFCLIYNRLASHLYSSEEDVFRLVVKGFRILQDCQLGKI